MSILTYAARLEVYILFCVFIYTNTLCMQATKAVASLCNCTNSPEPSLLDDTICSKIACACLFFKMVCVFDVLIFYDAKNSMSNLLKFNVTC